MNEQKPTKWDGSTVHVESAIAASNPSREQNIQTIAARLARLNEIENAHDALVLAAKSAIALLEDDVDNALDAVSGLRAALALVEVQK